LQAGRQAGRRCYRAAIDECAREARQAATSVGGGGVGFTQTMLCRCLSSTDEERSLLLLLLLTGPASKDAAPHRTGTTPHHTGTWCG